MNEESRELMQQALEEAEQEMRQKMDLIRQIRAMEAVPINRFKLVDLSERAGHGLLSEMSIIEVGAFVFYSLVTVVFDKRLLKVLMFV